MSVSPTYTELKCPLCKKAAVRLAAKRITPFTVLRYCKCKHASCAVSFTNYEVITRIIRIPENKIGTVNA